MTKERLAQIKQQTERHLKQADRILNGDSEYDGADGARCVAELGDMLLETIQDLEPHCAPLPPVAGRECP